MCVDAICLVKSQYLTTAVSYHWVFLFLESAAAGDVESSGESSSDEDDSPENTQHTGDQVLASFASESPVRRHSVHVFVLCACCHTSTGTSRVLGIYIVMYLPARDNKSMRTYRYVHIFRLDIPTEA